jgi:two-component system, chemotaxis family, CheB/CheR fusion protein
VSTRATQAAGTADSHEFASLLNYLKSSRGFDFTGYKRSSLERRIRKRMDAVKIEGYADYEDYLEVHPDEFEQLFDTILINVTGFFRDRPAWEFLANDVIPRLLEDTPKHQPIRVWSAACASGEEAYTAAILLADLMGDDEFRRRVKIYATDVDEDALTTARHAVFPRQATKSVPDHYLDRYFEPNSGGLVFRNDLRRSVIFGRNDLVQDAPISRVDLLISRNSLMYFTPETQARILAHFNFSLRDTGFLFLGKSEMLIAHAELFTPYQLKWRVFRKVPRGAAPERNFIGAADLRFSQDAGPERYAVLRQGAADASPVPQLTVDRSGFVAGANEAARAAFGISVADIGRPLQDLEISYRPAELRAPIEQALEERTRVPLGRVQWQAGIADQRVLEVEVAPLGGGAGTEPLGASITFADVTAHAHLDEQFRAAQRELEAAYEELQSTVEELETTNEELQSTNEELETTNEELQSTNEELETMNEELQSTNDELEAMNEIQGERAGELDRLNIFLKGALSNLGLGVVVLDPDQRVQLWNNIATELWGLRDSEVIGAHFLSLDIGFPVETLKRAIRQALSSPDDQTSDLVVDAVNRRGRQFRCQVRILPLDDDRGNTYGSILLMSEAS